MTEDCTHLASSLTPADRVALPAALGPPSVYYDLSDDAAPAQGSAPVGPLAAMMLKSRPTGRGLVLLDRLRLVIDDYRQQVASHVALRERLLAEAEQQAVASEVLPSRPLPAAATDSNDSDATVLLPKDAALEQASDMDASLRVGEASTGATAVTDTNGAETDSAAAANMSIEAGLQAPSGDVVGPGEAETVERRDGAALSKDAVQNASPEEETTAEEASGVAPGGQAGQLSTSTETGEAKEMGEGQAADASEAIEMASEMEARAREERAAAVRATLSPAVAAVLTTVDAAEASLRARILALEEQLIALKPSLEALVKGSAS